MKQNAIQQALKPFNMSRVSKATGIPETTLHRIRNGHDARYQTMEKLRNWLKETGEKLQNL